MPRPLDVIDSASNALVRLLLAPDCVACHAPLDEPLDGPVCASCWRAISRLSPPYCARCGDALPSLASVAELCGRCRAHDPLVQLARSAGQYTGSLRKIVHAFKYERRRALAAPLAQLMYQAGGEVLSGADAVVPVPLSLRRALHRGFNQADDLARHLGVPVWRVLKRTRHGPPQAGLPAAQRLSNVRGAYAVRRFSAHRLRNRDVVLIDDVMTTGATLDACAEVLLDAGASNVRALTTARAAAAPPARSQPPPHPSTARHR